MLPAFTITWKKVQQTSNQSKFSKTDKSYSKTFRGLSRTTFIFKDFQGVEFASFKFKDSQGFSRTRGNPAIFIVSTRELIQMTKHITQTATASLTSR